MGTTQHKASLLYSAMVCFVTGAFRTKQPSRTCFVDWVQRNTMHQCHTSNLQTGPAGRPRRWAGSARPDPAAQIHPWHVTPSGADPAQHGWSAGGAGNQSSPAARSEGGVTAAICSAEPAEAVSETSFSLRSWDRVWSIEGF